MVSKVNKSYSNNNYNINNNNNSNNNNKNNGDKDKKNNNSENSKNSKLNIRNILTIIFLIVGIVMMYIIFKQNDIKDIISVYANFNIWLLLLYFIAVTGIFVILTWRWDVILRSRKMRVSFIKLFYYRIIGTAINFFTPGPRVGGEPTQASLLQRHNLDFTKSLSTIMIDKIIDTTTSGILFIIGVILIMIQYSVPKKTMIFMVIGGILFTLLVIIFYYRMLNSKHFFLHIFKFFKLENTKNKLLLKIEKKIEEIELIMIDFYKNDKRAFLKTLIISIISWVVMFIEYKLATTLLGLNLNFVELFFIISFVGIAMLFPIPMAVGVLEAGQISAFSILGLSSSAAIALAFLIRIKDIVWGIIGLILLSIFGFDAGEIVKKEYRKKIRVKKEKI